MPRYASGLDVVAERFLEEEHTPIGHMSPRVVRGVHHLDHGKPAKVQRCPRCKCHISQCHSHILIAMPYNINATDQHYLLFAAITNDQVLVVGAREGL